MFWNVIPCSLVEVYRRSEEQASSQEETGGVQMEAVCTSETSLNLYRTTRHHIQEDSAPHIKICLREIHFVRMFETFVANKFTKIL
jgi:hypothetical protein